MLKYFTWLSRRLPESLELPRASLVEKKDLSMITFLMTTAITILSNEKVCG